MIGFSEGETIPLLGSLLFVGQLGTLLEQTGWVARVVLAMLSSKPQLVDLIVHAPVDDVLGVIFFPGKTAWVARGHRRARDHV